MKHLIILLSLISLVFSATPKNIIGYTFTLQYNDSLVILDATTQQLIKSQYVGTYIHSITATALDAKNRIYYVYVFSFVLTFSRALDRTIKQFNADTLDEIYPEIPLYQGFSEGQYDQEFNQMIGVMMVWYSNGFFNGERRIKVILLVFLFTLVHLMY
jgi:hypothetical protein